MAKLDLLRYLFRLRDRWVLPQAIAGELGSRTETVHAEMESLLREGYSIEYHPSRGYRFRPGPDLLDPWRIREGLDPTLVGVEVHCLLEARSTMDEAWSRAEGGCPSGTVVLAERQRKGRGRFGRSWESPRGGGIWMSVLLKGEAVPDPPPLLTVTTAVAVVEGMETLTGLPGRIRWPNDIVVRGRKVGGILIEMRQGPGGPMVVVGIGVNVDLSPFDLGGTLGATATSVSAEREERTDREALVRAILSSLDLWVGRAARGERDMLGERWRALSTNLGRRATIVQGERRFTGVVVDLDPAKGLSLDLGEGRVRTFPAEHVSLLEAPDPAEGPAPSASEKPRRTPPGQ